MNNDVQGQLVLAQNQFALVQDTTKGSVQVYTGPHAVSLSPNDKPVIYDSATDVYKVVTVAQAVQQNPRVPEGHYLVLENPAFDANGNLVSPEKSSNMPTALQTGRKINIPGPVTFPLWPGQTAKAVPGHHMRSNQYLVVRVYNAEEANKNRPDFLHHEEPFDNGQLLVIKGTEVSFHIPPTGFEVLIDVNNSSTTYVREALTLEQLEYCILLDENGKKRYAHGPQVVFPEATETFIYKNDEDTSGSSRKFKMIELNDQMGLYLKVISDYEDEVTADTVVPAGITVVARGDKSYAQYKTGQELFITGKEQRIYCPRPEHALIGYSDPQGNKRQRYYGIAIPRGEGRYVLDKISGGVETESGPQIFLPDPRNEIVIRRVLDDKTVKLWYPGNSEALAFNQHLRSITPEGGDYITDQAFRSSVMNVASASAGMSSSLMYSKGGRFEGEELHRRTSFTPPPTLTLNTKYDGVPSITIWTGYAVQIVNKVGERRVVVGPTTTLLQYDETLEVLELSTGKPKNTDSLKRDVYLRIDHNLVSDMVRIETKDLVTVEIRVSYRVNFLREHQDKWFNVENYVKYLCDHLRSILKSAARKASIKDWTLDSTELVRNAVLGDKTEGQVRHRIFSENGMEVYDVEVLGVQVVDENIRQLISRAQQEAVQGAIRLGSAEQKLELTKKEVGVNSEITELETSLIVKKEELARLAATAKSETTMQSLSLEISRQLLSLKSEVDSQEQHSAIASSTLARERADGELKLEFLAKQTELFEKRMAAIAPNLIEAMVTLGNTEFMSKLTTALAPLALAEQQGLGQTIEKVFAGTPIAPFLSNISNGRVAAASAGK